MQVTQWINSIEVGHLPRIEGHSNDNLARLSLAPLNAIRLGLDNDGDPASRPCAIDHPGCALLANGRPQGTVRVMERSVTAERANA